MNLALYTFGQFIKPADSSSNDDFHELNDPVFESADKHPGLIARSGYASDPGPSSWGEEVYPRFYDDLGDGWAPATLSLWRDLESVYLFTYSGFHADILKRGREWFRKPEWPPLVLWWHDRAENPTWAEGVERLEYLHDHGPTPHGFTFKQVFDATGKQIETDQWRTLKSE